MEIKDLKNAVKNPKVRVIFKDKNGRINHIVGISDDVMNKFIVNTLVVSTSMYWTDSYMDHDYIMGIIEGEIKLEEVVLDKWYY